jgi:hypothetical protein
MRRSVLGLAAVCATLASPVAVQAHWEAGLAAGASTSGVSQSGPVGHVANLGGTTGGHVVVEGDRLYMGMYGVGMRIFDISQPAAPVELAQWRPADSAIGPRAVADAPPDAGVFDGRNIAVLNGTGRTARQIPSSDGRTDNTYFLDTTDPANIELLWTFEGVHDGESHNGDIVDSRRWWLPSGGRTATEGGQTLDNGLRIYDLQPLLGAEPAAPEVLFRGDPVKLWEASPYRGGKPVGPVFTHTHDISVYPDFEVNGTKRDIALLAEGGNYTDNNGNTGSMFVIDITNPQAPVVLQRWLHERGPEHHPIRYHHEVQFLHGDPRTVLVTDEDLHNGCSAGGVTTMRLSADLTSAQEVSEWFIADGLPAGTTFGPVCSVHVFSSHANLVYFGSYNAGLQVVDYSDPANPRRLGHNVQLGADSWGAEYLRDGIVYVGDFGSRGLDVFQVGAQHDHSVLTPTVETSKKATSLVTTVANQGSVGAPEVAFEFREGATVLSRQTVPALDPGEQHKVSIPWSTRYRGTRTVTAVVDVGDRYDEVSEDNNERSATLAGKGR